MIVDRDGGRSPGELPGEKAVGREDFQMRRLALAPGQVSLKQSL